MGEKVSESLLRLASEDLASARALLTTSRRNAAFHVQQAAEKLVKAVLVEHGTHPPKTHDIRKLADELPKDHAWHAPLAALASLTPSAVGYRYPTAEGDVPDTPDADGIVADTARVQALLARAAVEFALSL